MPRAHHGQQIHPLSQIRLYESLLESAEANEPKMPKAPAQFQAFLKQLTRMRQEMHSHRECADPTMVDPWSRLIARADSLLFHLEEMQEERWPQAGKGKKYEQ